MKAAARALVAAALAAAGPAGAAEPVYELRYDARIVPTKRAAEVSIRVSQTRRELVRLRLRIDPERHREFHGDGELASGPGWVEWRLPPAGGALHYTFRIDHLRDQASYDARCAESWAIFRGDDLVPPARAFTHRRARARARLRLRVPTGWSAVTRFEPTPNGTLLVEDPRRRFDRPTGWIVVGRGLGVVRERVSGSRVAIAGPAGQGLRRLDLLALLRWTLPELGKIVELPERLLVVGAGDPMWRGGLSAPASLFLHAQRPLLTPDTSSPLLHEVMHTALRARSAQDADWIVEGLAEYYSLELLVRSRTISRSRHERALARLIERGRQAPSLASDDSAGAVTARAVGFFRSLDAEIRQASGGQRSLDDALRPLAAEEGPFSPARLLAAAEKAAGRELAAFFQARGVEVASAAPPAATSR